MQNSATPKWSAQILDRTYRLLDRLGQGGMGTVFRAIRLLDGTPVAVKLVAPPDSTSAQASVRTDHLFRLALAREFQTLASLHHPHVVRVFSYGFDQRLGPYVAMELLENSRSLLAAGMDLSLLDKVQLVVQLLRALSYVHQRGVIHRDIKSGNVLVTAGAEGPEVKLVDFGISTGKGQTARLAGTVEYMAPELLLGYPPSPASDLWAVGILLHQLLTGRLPFESQTPTAVLSGILGASSEETVTPTVAGIMAHYRSARKATGPESDWSLATLDLKDSRHAVRPAAPSASHAELDSLAVYPGALGTVLQKLLARQPEERYQAAQAVLPHLARAVDLELPVETASTRESFLQATALIGREAELSTLQADLESAFAGHGNALLLGGESGIGKSRLLAELRTLALVHGAWVTEGHSVPQGGAFFHEFLPFLRTLCLRVEVTDPEAAVLKDLIPEVAQLLARPIPGAPTANPAETLQRLVDTLVGLLSRLERPLVLIFEDLHWGRSESLELLSRLQEQLGGLPVLWVGSYRSDERPNLPERLPAARSLRLGRLGRASIEELTASMLGDGGRRPALIEYLERQTEGNMFFLVEVVRALAESAGELRRIGQGELPEQVLTSGIERIIERRLSRVRETYRPMLAYCAVLGRQLDPRLLAHQFPTFTLQDFLIEGANAAVLENVGTEWQFAHDKLREGTLRYLQPTERQQLHCQIAEGMETLYRQGQRLAQSLVLAYHFRESGRLERAIPYLLQAGAQARQLCLLEDARAQYDAAEAALAQLPESLAMQRHRIDLLLLRIQASLLTDALEIQLRREQEAKRLLKSICGAEGPAPEEQQREARLNLHIGQVYYFAGQPAAAIDHFQRVLSQADKLAEPELLVFPAFVTGQALTAQGHMKAGQALLEQAVGPLEQIGSVFDSLRGGMLHAIAKGASGQYRQSVAQMRSLQEKAHRINQLTARGMSEALSMVLYRLGGDWPALHEAAMASLDYVRRSGDKVYLFCSLGFAGWAEAALGQNARAAESFAQAFELARAGDSRLLLKDWIEAAQAEGALLADKPAEALTLARDLLYRSKKANLVLSAGIAERVWGCALSLLGHSQEEAETHLRHSLRIHSESGNILDAAQTEQWWGRISLTRGNKAAAQEHFHRAHSIFESAGCEYAAKQTQQEAME